MIDRRASRTLTAMSDSKITEIQAIHNEVDAILRKRLAPLGVNVGHVLLAVLPDGVGIVRSNVGPAERGDMAELLAEIADASARERPAEEPHNCLRHHHPPGIFQPYRVHLEKPCAELGHFRRPAALGVCRMQREAVGNNQ